MRCGPLCRSRRCCSTHRISIILIQSASTEKAASTWYDKSPVIVVVGLPGNKVVQSRPPVPTCPCQGIRTSSAKMLSSARTTPALNQQTTSSGLRFTLNLPPLRLNTFFVSIWWMIDSCSTVAGGESAKELTSTCLAGKWSKSGTRGTKITHLKRVRFISYMRP